MKELLSSSTAADLDSEHRLETVEDDEEQADRDRDRGDDVPEAAGESERDHREDRAERDDDHGDQETARAAEAETAEHAQHG